MTETELRRFYVARCTKRMPDVRMFIRNVGAIEVDGRVFKTGIKGQSDVWGWVKHATIAHAPVRLERNHWPPPLFAMPFEVELKNVRTRVTPEQTVWARFCEQWGVPRLELRAEKNESVDQILERWVSETESWIAKLKA